MVVSAQELKSLALDKPVALQSCGDYFALERALGESAAYSSEFSQAAQQRGRRVFNSMDID